MFKVISIILILLLLFSISSIAGEYGRLKGIVVDSATGNPLRKSLIILAGTSLQAKTNKNGKFIIEDIPQGTYDIITSKTNFLNDSLPNFNILAGYVYNIGVELIFCYTHSNKGPKPIRRKGEHILKSPAFTENGIIPVKYTCDGENISPPFEIYNLPKKAKFWGVLLESYEGIGNRKLHWLIYNIPVRIKELPENIIKMAETNLKTKSRMIRLGQIQNDFNKIGYYGPCPSENGKRNYNFGLFTLDKTVKFSRDEIEAGITEKLFWKRSGGYGEGGAYLKIKYERE